MEQWAITIGQWNNAKGKQAIGMDDLTVDHCDVIETIVIGQWTIVKGQ